MEEEPAQHPRAEKPLRCLSCGGEMVLIKTIEDWTMPIVGFERHAYMCSACGSTEQRTVFNKQAKERHDAEVVAVLRAPHMTPTANVENQRSAQGFFGRVLAKLRSQKNNLFG